MVFGGIIYFNIESKPHFSKVPAFCWPTAGFPINHCTKYSRPGWQLEPRSARPQGPLALSSAVPVMRAVGN